MRLVAMQELHVPPERMRLEFQEEALQELQLSIMSKGLMHAPACRQVEGKIYLVAGERRFRVMTRLHKAGTPFMHDGEAVPSGMIPYTLLHELPVIDILEAEFEENVRRKDLTWQEQAAARARLFKLRQEQAAKEGKEYDRKTFAEELQKAGVPESSIATVVREIAVADHLDKEIVKKAANLKDAAKAVGKERESFIMNALARAVDAAPPLKHTFIEGDCLDAVRNIPDRSFDCICTDPPYGIGIHDSGSMVTHEHHYDDSPAVLENILERLPDHLYRICKVEAHLYWFCDLTWFPKIAYALEQAGFKVCKYPITWGKRGKSMAPDIARWPRRTTEWIVYAIKGDKAPLKVADDLIVTTYGSDLQQAEKPKELYVELLSRSCLAGATVIDPFCGSGVIFTAADELKLAATGIEKDPERGIMAKLRAYGATE